MKRLALVLMLVCLPAGCLAYESGMLNLKVPFNLEREQAEFNVRHRFFGEIDEEPFDTFFGMDAGANVNLALRGPVWRNLEVRTGYTRDFSEWTLGAGYALRFQPARLRAQVDVDFFSFEESDVTGRDENFFYRLALETEPLGGRLKPALNIGYDGHHERIGLGLGARLDVLERVSLLGEYYPVLDRDEDDPASPAGPEDVFALGLELKTYGHRFVFMVGNTWEIGTRRLMLGASSNDLYFGFNIMRLLEF
jgi:hypothetical protein